MKMMPKSVVHDRVIGDRVSLYSPDQRQNGKAKGTIVGGGFQPTGLFYAVELDEGFRGISQGVEIYVRVLLVHVSGVFSTND